MKHKKHRRSLVYQGIFCFSSSGKRDIGPERPSYKAEKEKNRILVGKMAELKLEQKMYKERIADLEEFIAKQNESRIVQFPRQPD